MLWSSRVRYGGDIEAGTFIPNRDLHLSVGAATQCDIDALEWIFPIAVDNGVDERLLQSQFDIIFGALVDPEAANSGD